MAVDAAVGHEADEVQRVPAAGHAIHGGGQHRVREQLTVADALVDPREVLVDDPAGPHVHVADFGVAHLPGGQADRLARGDQLRVRISFEQLVEDRRARQRDGVVLALGTDSPAVEHDENELDCRRVASSGVASAGVQRANRRRPRVARRRAQLLFDPQELVVFRDAIRSARRAGLDLARAGRHGEIRDGRVFRLARSMRDDARVAASRAMATASSVSVTVPI